MSHPCGPVPASAAGAFAPRLGDLLFETGELLGYTSPS
jgi:hypothetical protein